MNAPHTTGKRLKAMDWRELTAVAKRTPALVPVTISIILNEADEKGDAQAVDAATYCLDTYADDPVGSFALLDEMFDADDRFERVQHLGWYYNGGEVSDWRFDQIMGDC